MAPRRWHEGLRLSQRDANDIALELPHRQAVLNEAACREWVARANEVLEVVYYCARIPNCTRCMLTMYDTSCHFAGCC